MLSTQEKETSRGEALMPFLLAALETCWIDAILIGLANTGILGTTATLVPLWLPLPLLAAFAFLTRWLDSIGSGVSAASTPQRRRFSPLYVLRAVLMLVAALLVAWICIYAEQKSLFDKSWLLDLSATIVQVNGSAFHIACILAFALLLCQHGNFLAHARSTPAQVYRMFQLGLVAMAFLVPEWLVLATLGLSFQNSTLVLALLALFLCLALVAHALARVIFVRRRHPVGLTGSVGAQERLVLRTVVILVCLFLLITLAIGSIMGPLLPGIGGTEVTTHRPGVVGPPVIPPCNQFCHKLPGTNNKTPVHNSGNPVDALALVMVWLLPTLYIVFLLLVAGGGTALGVFVWRRWSRSRQGEEEIHESLWSWRLFWQQFRGLLAVLTGRFAFLVLKIALWRKRKGTHMLSTEHAAVGSQSIRELYRSLLGIAALHGCPRERYETPYEFSVRLGQYLPSRAAQVDVITEAYVAARYGEVALDERRVLEASAWLYNGL